MSYGEEDSDAAEVQVRSGLGRHGVSAVLWLLVVAVGVAIYAYRMPASWTRLLVIASVVLTIALTGLLLLQPHDD